MITYHVFEGDARIQVPLLHQITYSPNVDYHSADKWCKENCKGKFYFSLLRKTVQFEDDQDAMLFALRWS
jgi:hypothetical protein